MYGRVFKNTNIDSGTENTKLIGWIIVHIYY